MSKKQFIKDLKGIAMLLLSTIIILGVGILAINEDDEDLRYKSVEIEEGDSLWSLAEEYKPSSYKSNKEYIEDLKELNGLIEDDLQEGNYIIVIYEEIE